MTYKFNGENTDLEIMQNGYKTLSICINDKESIINRLVIELNDKNLYDLIGALHSIQTKMKKDNFENLSNTF